MDLILNNLISNHILIPKEYSCDHIQQLEIHYISIFEQDCLTFFYSLKNQTLIFFPLGTSVSLTHEKMKILSELSCIAVLYKDDPLAQSITNLASLLSVPVYFIESNTTISSAVSMCYHLAYSKMHKLVEASLETMEKLFAEIQQHKGENKNIIKVATDLLECPVAYATADYHIQKAPNIPKEYLVVNQLYTEDSFNWSLALDGFHINQTFFHSCLGEKIGGSPMSGYLYQNKYCLKHHYRIFIFPITDTSNCYGYLFLALNDIVKKLTPEKCIKIQQLLAILKFEVIKSNEIAHTVNRYYDFLLDELIESDQTDFRKLMQKYGLVQKVIFDEYYVLIAGRSPRNISDTIFHELLTSQQFNSLYDQLVNTLGTINFFLFERKDYIITFLPKQLIKDIKKDLMPVISIFKEFLQEQYMGAGISDIVSTQKIRQGYMQALKALTLSQNAYDKSPCFYADLGILRFFYDHSNQVDLAPLLLVYNEYIAPIIKYDKEHTGELLSTLTSYISNCFSPSAICSELYIHKNTLYSRLSKITHIIGKNLSDSETIFNISLGLKIHILIQTGILSNNLNP